MKKIYIWLALCLALVMLAACSPAEGGDVTTDVTTQAPVTDAPPETDAREYMRVGFLYPYAQSWRFDFAYYRVGETPALPASHTPDAYFKGWTLDGAPSEPTALEAVGELTTRGEEQSRVGGYAELLSLCDECHYAYVAKYEYPEKVNVSVIGADGQTRVTEVGFGQKLPSEIFENTNLPTLPAGERAEIKGWLYSLDGKEWLPCEKDMRATANISVKPDVKHYCLLTLNAGKGTFGGDAKRELWLEKGTLVNVALLEPPQREADGDKTYVFAGYLNSEGKRVSEITLMSAVTLKADYEVSEKVYTVTVVTERGVLPGGGKSATFTVGYKSALEIVERYKNATYDTVAEDGEVYEASGVELFENGTVWTVVVKWRNAASYTVYFEHDGAVLFTETVHKGESLILPEDEHEDEYGYYVVSGWLGEDGTLYAVHAQIEINADTRLTAQWKLAERKTYTVTFTTDKGTFADGNKTVSISGYYGDALTPPAPPSVETLTYGGVVFTFVGWNADVPTTICESAEFCAVYTTEQPVYYLTYIIDGEIYAAVPYYAGAIVTLVEPDEVDGVMFGGWRCDDVTIDISGGSFLMPAADTTIYGSFERAEFDVHYYVDGVLTYTDTHSAGTTVTLRPLEVKHGYKFSYIASVEITDGKFIMPAENVRIDGEFSPNVHSIIFLDSVGGNVIFIDELEYGSEFSVSDIECYREGEYTSAWGCVGGLPDGHGDDIVMPDNDVVFVAAWSPTLTVGLDGVWLPYYGGEGEAEFDGFYFDEAAGVLYIYDAALTVAGAAEGVSVVYDIKPQA